MGITALAAVLRVLALGEVPPGLYHDEAFNGLDALRVIHGRFPVYFAANRGREPLFIYLIAVTVRLLGRTPGALRLAAAVCGTLTIPATFLMARAWFNRRIALLSAAIMATTLWHVHLSRVGFRAVTLPLVTALALWFGARALCALADRDKYSYRWPEWLLAGLFYGLTFYTYMPARFTLLVLVWFALYLLLGGYGSRLWPGSVYFAGGALVVLTPLAIYAVGHWDVTMGRPGQVSVFNPLINGGDLWGTLGRQLLGTLGMFFVRGDSIPRHNLPGRPVFLPLMGAAMVVGLARAVRRARRRDMGSVLALLWVGTMLAPTWLAEDAPHFLRAVGVLPLITVFPALGLDAVQSWLERRGRRSVAMVLVCAVLGGSLAATAWDYFVRYRSDRRARYAFEDAAARLAAEVNRFVGVGWDGSGFTALGSGPRSGRRVYVDSRLWNEWAAIPFLVPETGAVTELPPQTSPPLTSDDTTLLLLWPYGDVGSQLSLLPRNVSIEVRRGPLTRGDLEETLYAAYVAYTVGPDVEQSNDYLARFGDRIALVDYKVIHHREWELRLTWEVLASPEESYTVFVHLYDGEQLIDQDDGEPGGGYYPTNLWRSGDSVIETRVLRPPKEWRGNPRLTLGMYVWPTMERLGAVGPSGESLGDEVTLPVTRPDL